MISSKQDNAFLPDAVWRRHANPWSVWTRLPILLLATFVLWFRENLGWGLWPALALLALWTWLNPRVFPEPRDLNSWASRAVLGERIWLTRKFTPIPAHHTAPVQMLVFGTFCGFVVLAVGLVFMNATSVIAGLLLTYAGKLWFLDRMVWLQRETSSQTKTLKP